jgi:hypothetical protein
MASLARLPLALLLLAPTLFLLKSSLQFAYATILSTNPATLRQALTLTPANPDWRVRLAGIEPSNRTAWLDSALALDPNLTLARIERGVHSEISNNPAAAESDFLEAARRDHQYLPRWTLAAFYFRQHDRPHFQTWARQALEMAYGDALPLFQMAGQLGMTVQDIRQTLLPDRPPVYQAFLTHTLDKADYPAAAEAAQHLIQIGTAARYRDPILYAVDALFRAGQIDPSVALWNQAANAHWIPHAPLRPAMVANPEFAFEFLPAGFDWTHNPIDGVVFWRTRGYQIELSHNQPESCTLTTLPLPLEPGRTYRLQVAATTEIAPNSGLTWQIQKQTWDAAKPVDATFTAPPKPEPQYLRLTYTRALGTKRLEGTLTLQKVTIEPTEPAK